MSTWRDAASGTDRFLSVEVVEEAYEMVEKGLITGTDFRDFTFTNPVRFFAGMNPDFFKGTAVEAEVAKVVF